MWIKGSGGDLGTLKKSGCAALFLQSYFHSKMCTRVENTKTKMVALFNHCIYDLDSKAPSIDTPLHAFCHFIHRPFTS